MADFSSNPLSGLYPQPPAPQPNLLASNPLGLLQLGSQMAVGRAYQNALAPNGTFDQGAFNSAVAASPIAALSAPEAAALRNSGIEANTNQFGLLASQNATLQNVIGSLGPGTPPLEAKSQLLGVMARTGIPPDMTANLLAGMPEGEQAYRDWLGNLRKMALGTAGASTMVPGPVTQGGAETSIPLGQAATSGGYVIGLSPAASAAATTAGAGFGGEAINLTQAADGSPIRKAMLGNLENDLQSFTSGPGADWTKVAKGWANRNILPQGMQFDPRSIASQEEFNKQAGQLAQQQFSVIGGTGTDAKFNSAYETNPNDALSKLGNTGVIHLLKGNEDAIQAKNHAWQDWLSQGNGPDSYPQFARQFNQSFDPRVYQSQYMGRDDFMRMVKSMSPGEQAKFRANMIYAQQHQYASSPGSFYGGQ